MRAETSARLELERRLRHALDAHQLAQACRQATCWHPAAPDGPLTVAVNLSVRQLTQPDPVLAVGRSIAAQIPPAWSLGGVVGYPAGLGI
jgi:EAL domain-containing protein (putative c-di-GMP-specific phosphodiesterase class I)